MNTVVTRVLAAAGAAALSASLAGCGNSEANAAAESVYDACWKPGAETELFSLEGDTVAIEVAGDAARAISGTDDLAENLEREGELSEEELDGFGILAGVYFGVQCLAEETGYPGSPEQLQDGDEWDGWRYSEEDGPGSEAEYSFTATG